MKNIKKFIVIFLIAIFLLPFISCKSIPQKLDRVEKEYSKEFREHLESLGDEKYLAELLSDGEQVELLRLNYQNLELELFEIKEKYSEDFGVYLEDRINDREHLKELISNEELVKLLNLLFELNLITKWMMTLPQSLVQFLS